jgi:hypothetical protein
MAAMSTSVPLSLFVGMGCYGQQLSMHTAQGLLELQQLCIAHQVPLQHCWIGNESLVGRLRDRIAHHFLRSGCTHLFLLDSDIAFKGADVLQLIRHGKEYVGAAYPCKGINWAAVKKAIQLDPGLSDEALGQAAGRFAFGVLDEQPSFPANQLARVKEIGTGFNVLQRSVFDKLIHGGGIRSSFQPHEGTEVHEFYQTGPDDQGRHLSEDYWLCDRWRKAGGEVWLDPTIDLGHVGSHVFTGSLRFLAGLEAAARPAKGG